VGRCCAHRTRGCVWLSRPAASSTHTHSLTVAARRLSLNAAPCLRASVVELVHTSASECQVARGKKRLLCRGKWRFSKSRRRAESKSRRDVARKSPVFPGFGRQHLDPGFIFVESDSFARVPVQAEIAIFENHFDGRRRSAARKENFVRENCRFTLRDESRGLNCCPMSRRLLVKSVGKCRAVADFHDRPHRLTVAVHHERHFFADLGEAY
jgi:hypothetical protein